MNNKRILVVDDDEGILEAMELMLHDAGYVVETTPKNGTTIDKKIKKLKPHLIILDVLLSGSDGRTICKKLKSQNETKHIPIIMISAHPDARKSALEAGADGFLAKPFDMGDLLARVEKHVKDKK